MAEAILAQALFHLGGLALLLTAWWLTDRGLRRKEEEMWREHYRRLRRLLDPDPGGDGLPEVGEIDRGE